MVHTIAVESRELLEIVNFNVDGEQYVCSGTVSCQQFSWRSLNSNMVILSQPIFTFSEN